VATLAVLLLAAAPKRCLLPKLGHLPRERNLHYWQFPQDPEIPPKEKYIIKRVLDKTPDLTNEKLEPAPALLLPQATEKRVALPLETFFLV
tara:strand:- start:59 stop:331 length:273 start_codon:yes stop_codon:yes gene_type:complete